MSVGETTVLGVAAWASPLHRARDAAASVLFGFLALVMVALAVVPIAVAASGSASGASDAAGSAAGGASSAVLSGDAGAVVADANGFGICGYLGSGMARENDWYAGGYQAPDSQGRRMTAEELLARGQGFMSFYGTGKAADDSWVIAHHEVTFSESDHVDEGSANSVRKSLTGAGCFMTGLNNYVANMFLSLDSAMLGLTKFFVTSAFDSNLVCRAAMSSSSCFDLITVIGGKSDNQKAGGLIGSLNRSVFQPLAAILVIINLGAAFAGAVRGSGGFKLREFLVEAMKSVGAGALGFALMSFPMSIASLPMKAAHSLSGVVIGAFNGSVSASATSSEKACQSYAAKGADNSSLAIESVSCTIWKAFVAGPTALMNFGLPFDELDTQAGDFAAKVKEKGFDGNEFCVNMKVSGTISQYKNSNIIMDPDGGDKLCNIAAYAMMLRLNVVNGPGDAPFEFGQEDARWYKLIGAAQAHPKTWTLLSNTTAVASLRPGAAVGMNVVGALGSVVLVVTSAHALIHYLMTVLLMPFFPIFMLLLVSRRWRRYTFGYFEKIAGNVLKFMMSAVFLMVAIAVYGAVLMNLSTPLSSTLFVIIITAALLLYRKEIVSMLGRVSFQGEQMSSRAVDWARSIGDRTRSRLTGTSTALVGGAVGGALAGTGMLAGMRSGFLRNASRQSGLMGQAVRVATRNSADAKRELQLHERDIRNEGNASRDRAAAADFNIENERRILDDMHSRLKSARNRVAGYSKARFDRDKTIRGIGRGELAREAMRGGELKQRLQDMQSGKIHASAAEKASVARLAARDDLRIKVVQSAVFEQRAQGYDIDEAIMEKAGDAQGAADAAKEAARLRAKSAALKLDAMSEGFKAIDFRDIEARVGESVDGARRQSHSTSPAWNMGVAKELGEDLAGLPDQIRAQQAAYDKSQRDFAQFMHDAAAAQKRVDMIDAQQRANRDDHLFTQRQLGRLESQLEAVASAPPPAGAVDRVRSAETARLVNAPFDPTILR